MTIQEDGTTKSRPYNWPTREEWAYRIQHPAWDSGMWCPFRDKYSHRLSDHATAEEIAALTTALKELYREFGRELRPINLRIKPFRQQRGEGHAAAYQRFRQLPQEDREAFIAAQHLEMERSQINELLAKIRDDAIPDWHRGSLIGGAAELVAPFAERYRAAFHAACEQWEQECLQRPVDDAAWEKELKWRAQIEQRHYDNQRL